MTNLPHRRYGIAFEVFRAGILEHWKKELYYKGIERVVNYFRPWYLPASSASYSSPTFQEDYITKEEYSMVSLYAAPTIIPIWLFSAAFGLSHKKPYFVSMHCTFDDYQNVVCQIGNMELPLKYLGKVFYNSQFDSPLSHKQYHLLTHSWFCWQSALLFMSSGNTLPWENALEITFE